MTSFTFTAPDGKSYDVDGPEGATQEQAFAVLQQRLGGQAQPQPAPAAPQQPDQRGTLTRAVSNLPRSAGQFADAIAQTVAHPIDTLGTLGELGVGAVQNALPESLQAASAAPQRQKAGAVGGYFKDRYGGLSNVRETFAEDPVGLAADLSTVLTGGAGVAAKVPALAKAATTVGKVGRAIEPLAMAGKVAAPVARLAGKGVAQVVGGLGTRTGAASVEGAFQAGKAGGQQADVFRENMRGNVPQSDVVQQAKSAIDQLRQERGAAYRDGMAQVSGDKTVLDFAPIEQAFRSQQAMGTYKGKVINNSTVKTQQDIGAVIDDWAKSDPAEFHTPEGLDALKKSIGDIRESTEIGSPSRKVADNAYNAVKAQIVKQAPTYAKVMKDYELATDLVREIEQSLSLGKKASADTALRKLQNVMKAAQSGTRMESLRKLEQVSPDLVPALAGQSMNALVPNSVLGRSVMGGAGLATAGMAGFPAAAAALAVQSPRLVGEAAYYAGKGTNALNRAPVSRAGNVLYQAQQPKED